MVFDEKFVRKSFGCCSRKFSPPFRIRSVFFCIRLGSLPRQIIYKRTDNRSGRTHPTSIERFFLWRVSKAAIHSPISLSHKSTSTRKMRSDSSSDSRSRLKGGGGGDEAEMLNIVVVGQGRNGRVVKLVWQVIHLIYKGQEYPVVLETRQATAE